MGLCCHRVPRGRSAACSAASCLPGTQPRIAPWAFCSFLGLLQMTKSTEGKCRPLVLCGDLSDTCLVRELDQGLALYREDRSLTVVRSVRNTYIEYHLHLTKKPHLSFESPRYPPAIFPSQTSMSPQSKGLFPVYTESFEPEIRRPGLCSNFVSSSISLSGPQDPDTRKTRGWAEENGTGHVELLFQPCSPRNHLNSRINRERDLG